MKKFQIRWVHVNYRDVNIPSKTNRKYSAVRISAIETLAMKKFIPLLERLPIKSLTFTDCFLTSLEFQQILAAVSENLLKIEIRETNICHCDSPQGYEIGFPNYPTSNISSTRSGIE